MSSFGPSGSISVTILNDGGGSSGSVSQKRDDLYRLLGPLGQSRSVSLRFLELASQFDDTGELERTLFAVLALHSNSQERSGASHHQAASSFPYGP
jgi:hypothetical protein